MKKVLAVLFLSIIVLPVVSFAQTSTVVPLEVRIVPNTVNKASLSIDFTLDMGEESIDPDYWLDTLTRPRFSINYADQKASDCPLQYKVFMRPKGFGVIITGFNPSTLKRFINGDKDNQIRLLATKDITIHLNRKEDETEDRYWLIEQKVVNQMLSDQLTFTDEERSDFLTSLNNFDYYENLVDFGINPGRDTARSDYILTFRFQNAYNKKRFLSCKPAAKNPLNIYWNFDARVSTDFSDPLNYINFYPVNILFENFHGKVPYQWKIKAGNESSQNFQNKRVALDGEFNFIIPNLINLTTAQSNRLRLKPVISAGVKGYYDYSNGIDAFASGQAYLTGHYYIPVFTNYAIIIDGGGFYDFSDERNPGREIFGNYSITLGAEIPRTGFKAMFKYVNGRTDINFKQGSIISLGLLMDFFTEKK